jgi:alpha-beta hydrolase superfamily lysophospholipase
MLFEEHLIYFPGRSLDPKPTDLGLEYDEVWLTAADGVRVNGWALPPPGATRGWVLYSHGNADTMAIRVGIMKPLVERGLGVLLYDYRGYGRSEGRPDEEGTYRDAEVMLAETMRRAGEARRVFLMGESLGGGVSYELAVRHPELAGLITTSTFTSIPDMVVALLKIPALRRIVRTQYDNLAKVARITLPRLVLHGTRDELVPYRMGETLRDASRPPADFLAIAGAGHNDIFDVDPDGAYGALFGFIDRHLPRG